MSESVQPHRQQPTRLRGPWDSPGKSTGVGCHFLLQCMHTKLLQLCLTSCDIYGQQPIRLLCPQDSLGKNNQKLKIGLVLGPPTTIILLRLLRRPHWLSSLASFLVSGLCPRRLSFKSQNDPLETSGRTNHACAQNLLKACTISVGWKTKLSDWLTRP